MAINLFEHEYGFSATMLGFPSISGCRAVVVQTSDGLFGVHQASGPYPDRYKAFGAKLGKYLESHPRGKKAIVCVYGAAFLQAPQTGYGRRQEHLAEMSAYAAGVNHKGPVRCFDLSTALGGTGSAYVEFSLNGTECEVHVSQWVNPGPARTGYDGSRGDDHKTAHYQQDGFKPPTKILDSITPVGRKKMESWVKFS